MFELDFLEAADGTPLTKRFALVNGLIEKEPYPMVRNFTSHRETVHDIETLGSALKQHAEAKHCLLKGLLSKQIQDASRAGLTSAEAPTRYMVIDLDFHEGWASIDEFLRYLNPDWIDISYVFQHSVSAGISGKAGLRGHLFVLLDTHITPSLAKQWLMERNLDEGPTYQQWLGTTRPDDHESRQAFNNLESLRKKLSLTASGMSLRWPLDVTTCQNDKLIYIAPPILEGIDDPLGENRFIVKKGSREFAPAPKLRMPLAAVENSMHEAVTKLRAAAGLPKRAAKMRNSGGLQILTNPDRAVVTSAKSARGFTYVNLNGGDSWAYYFPEEKPAVLHNFKGEPAVRLQDIDPDFYQQYLDTLRQQKLGDIRPYVFREPYRCSYYNVLYDKAKDEIAMMAVASSKNMLEDFMVQHYASMPAPIEDWTVVFDPTTTKVIDPKAQWINTFRPTEYIRLAPQLTATHEIPPIIERVIRSICGNDDESFQRFINWLAHLFQTRRRTDTAWVFHGVQGTGKGVLISKILRPLFGPQHVVQWTMQNFEEIYNAGLERCLILFLDEFKANASKNVDMVMNKLKSYITEDIISSRGMRMNEIQVQNWLNVIIASNHPDPIQIPEHDRRMNVAPAQERPLKITIDEITRIESELPAFASFLWNYEVVERDVRSPLINAARDLMIRASRTTVDDYFAALHRGDIAWFLGYLRESMPLQDTVVYQQYETTILSWCQTLLNAQDLVLDATRDELRSVFHYIVGTPTTPAKFTRMCNIARMPLVSLTRRGKQFQGLSLLMKSDKEELARVVTELSGKPTLALVKS